MAAPNPGAGDGPEHIDAGQDDHRVAAAAQRLMAEFGGRVDLPTITRVVVDCRRDLRGVPEPAVPELLERYARQLLVHAPTR